MLQRCDLSYESFLRQVQQASDRIAIEYGDRAVTYQELAEQATRIAEDLRQLSPSDGSPVMVQIDKSINLAASMLGIWQAGLTYLPVDTRSPADRLRTISEWTHCGILIRERSNDVPKADGVGDATDGVSIDLLDTGDPTDTEYHGHRVLSTDPGYVVFTSGSTGAPKGVVVDQASLVELVDELVERYKIGPDDRVLQFAAPSFDTSIEQICVTLAAGATLVVPDYLWAPSEFHEQTRDRRITVMDLTPSYWREVMAASTREDTKRLDLRLAIVGGSAVHNRDLRRARSLYPGVRIVNAYGLTETVITSCLAEVHPERPLPDGPASVGTPLAGVSVSVVDAAGHLVPPGTPGEIRVSGRVARGIITGPDTFEALTQAHDTGPDHAGGTYYTGDLGVVDDHGNLTVLARKDRQVKVRGFRVDPNEVESHLQHHPSVSDAAVLADNPDRGLVAFYTVLPGHAHPGSADILENLRTKLPPHAVPVKAVAIPALPQTVHGKVDYRALGTVASHPQPSVHSDAALQATELEAAVAEIWRAVLGLDTPDPELDFFGAGGTSITAAELVARTRTSLGIHVSYVRPLIEDLLARPTLKEYCQAVEAARSGRLSASHAPHEVIQADLQRAVHVDQETFRPDIDPTDPRQILLTGATGFLGTHLLDGLLRKTTARISCLVRAESVEHGRQRLLDAWEKYGAGGDLISAAFDRIDIVVGDLSKRNLGVAEEDFDRIADQTEMIFHSGGTVNFIYPYAEMKTANVDGTYELLRLAARRGAHFHHASTMAVIAGKGVAGVAKVAEDDPLTHLHELGVGYAESKWVAEHLVRKVGEAGLPVAIYRAADISGHSVAGTWSLATEMCCMKKFISDIGAFPDAELPMDYTPVDVFSEALLYMALGARPVGRTYHLTNPNKTHISLLAERLRARGHDIQQVSWREWVSRMVELAVKSPSHPMTPFAPLFIDKCPNGRMSVAQMYLEDTFPPFSRYNVEEALADSPIVFPDVDDKLIDLYLDFLETRSFL